MYALRDGDPPVVLVLDHTASLGGAELALARLCETIDRSDVDVRVLLFEEGPLAERLRASGTPTRTVRLDSRVVNTPRNSLIGSPVALLRSLVSLLGFLPRLVAAVRGEHPDVIVTNSLKSSVLGSLAALFLRRPWVWHLHDRLADDYLNGSVARILVELARRGPRVVVANSRHTLSLVEPLARAHGYVVYPGVSLGEQPAHEVSQRPHTFGIVGRLGQTKGQREFLQAAASVAREHPAARFVVIGTAMFNDHAYAAGLRALADDLALQDSVEFLGWIDEGQALWSLMDTLVHASPTAEPFGQVIVEAMAAGVPVVATRAGGVAEILDPDSVVGDLTAGAMALTPFGTLVRPGDVAGLAAAMRQGIDDPDGALQRSHDAQRRAREVFSMPVTAQRVIAAWNHARA